MADYREYPPSLRLAHAVECIWTMRQEGGAEPHRVLPDGCADIIFTRTQDSATLEAVGPMTGYRDFPQSAAQVLVGIRFRPGMWTTALGVPGDLVTDKILDLDQLWGNRGRSLRNQLLDTTSLEQWINVLQVSLGRVPEATRLQQALAWMAERKGCIAVDELAAHSGCSTRQFRRLCLEQTGLTPKFLARVLRFRHALERVGTRTGSFADYALDCGYYDQAHLINEFRELSGWTPATCPDGRFFQSPMAGLGR